MKTKIVQFTALIACSLMLMGGCETVKTYATPANAHTATVLLTGGILANIANDTDRHNAACNYYAAAVGVRAFAEGGDHVPTPAELSAAILTFLPKAGKYVQFAEVIRGVWQSALPQIGGNVQKGLEWAEAIATGIEASAKPYCGPGILGTPIQVPPVPGPDGTPGKRL